MDLRKPLVLVCFLVSCVMVEVPSGDVPPPGDPTLVCQETVCPAGQYCIVSYGEEICVRNTRPGGFCDKVCDPGMECRFDVCMSPDLQGKVCEFDDACLRDEFCIQAHCTPVDCVPGDTYSCYSGPPDTRGIGECRSGFHLCTEEGFYTQECIGEVYPIEEVGLIACNGRDDDCDGIPDPMGISAVDIVFAFDISGSMSENLLAVAQAIRLTADMYNDASVRIGLIIFPDPNASYVDEHVPLTAIPLVEYADFTLRLSLISMWFHANGAREASWDVPVLVATGQQPDLAFRSNAKRVVVMFTDEEGQSYMSPPQDEASMCRALQDNGTDLYVVIDTGLEVIGGPGHAISEDFDDCATILPLTDDPFGMSDNLSDIAENICEDVGT